jgi:hypothetical protein
MTEHETHPLLRLFRERGLTRVEVDYDGSGDEGYIVDWRGWKGETEASEARTFSSWGNRSPWTKAPEGQEEVPESHVDLHETINNRVYEILEGFPFDWENNEGGFGTIRIDVVTGKVEVDHSQRYMDVYASSHEGQL